MFFMNDCFAGGEHSLDSSPLPATIIKFITIKNGIFDEIYVTQNANIEYSSTIKDIWDYNTVFHAKFQGNLFAGNTSFTVDNTDTLRIKRRIKGDFKWVCFYEIPIYSITDFSFEKFDYTARSNTYYEYCVVSVYGMIESGYIINETKTQFNGFFIFERDKSFKSKIETKAIVTQHKPISTVNTLGKKYPFIISNGINNFKSISISGVFAEINENDCQIDFIQSWQYREKLNDFLYNNIPKLIKCEEGRMWLVSISSDTIIENEKGHELLIETSFEATEIANCDNGADLYKYGFIDVKEVDGMVTEVSVTEQRLNKLEYDLATLRASKADNLNFNSSKGTIGLTAEGQPIGNDVDLETPFGKELLVKLVD